MSSLYRLTISLAKNNIHYCWKISSFEFFSFCRSVLQPSSETLNIPFGTEGILPNLILSARAYPGEIATKTPPQGAATGFI